MTWLRPQPMPGRCALCPARPTHTLLVLDRAANGWRLLVQLCPSHAARVGCRQGDVEA